ncbi:bifunctional biotin--[acetyl-CoA-carboxylase] ligase/biotin operon repressor BirA [Streptococcus plurextorum]|uniref:bifunctional biotin--[acetyl-CoA-carboxylase] ligase/biotin operon repressor BirA n=1 Tax=Streptococcus plurextorum TaxID=456876 RepID=UPI00047F7099|nr:bifunctional biotin--[acetyl-CoA-carboxylase] ligase/biotin operon repressor BirA [Streptococcus plurextorum]
MMLQEKIFERLYHSSEALSQAEIADALEIPSSAILPTIKILEEKGLSFEVTKDSIKWLSGDLLLPKKITERTGLPVTFVPSSVSTQLDAKKGMDEGLSSPRLYLAEQQTAARGRMNRSFFTEKNGGIYMSLHIKPNLSFDSLPTYTLMTASALVRAIHRLTGLDCDIKWVNDIYLNGKKIAGILTEAVSSIETGTITDVIIGVGINFQLQNIPYDLKHKVGSLFSDSQPTITRTDLISEMWHIFSTVSEKDLYKVYCDKSLVLDRHVTFSQNGQDYAGTAQDITPSGGLIVELDSGGLMEISSGEVSLSSW